ncbi:hypothetical protein GOODEAATRI_005728 [Goodea atripinnis]|uniref:Uncharacterized protein n=1 Tax=Goodea atripinnis TaxID=208336 RepID=A0ABV0NS58_9TELE
MMIFLRRGSDRLPDSVVLVIWLLAASLGAVLTKDTAFVEVVLFESSPNGDYTTYTTGLQGRFSKAGATISAEGEIVQVRVEVFFIIRLASVPGNTRTGLTLRGLCFPVFSSGQTSAGTGSNAEVKGLEKGGGEMGVLARVLSKYPTMITTCTLPTLGVGVGEHDDVDLAPVPKPQASRANTVHELTSASDFQRTRACRHATEEAGTWQGHAELQMELPVSSARTGGNNVAFS